MSMKELLNGNMATGINIDETATPTIHCKACIQAKAVHQSFPKESSMRAEKPSDLTHSDLWGPAPKASPGGSKYFISIIDDKTWHVNIKFIKSKSDAEREIQNYVAWIETQMGRMPKAFRTDNGGEYIKAKPWLDSKGIELHVTARHSPAQNGVSEWQNRTLAKLMRAMLAEKNLPETLWAEVIAHAAYIRNRSPTRATGMMLMEAWVGNKPDLSHLREFGTDVWILSEGESNKTQPKSVKMILVGFEDGSKAVRYYNPKTRRVNVSRNYTFMDPPSIQPPEYVQIPLPNASNLPLEGEYSVDINRDSLAKEAAPNPSIPNPSSIQNPDSPDSSENSPATPSKIPISTRILRQRPQKDYRVINDPQYRPRKGNESVMAEIIHHVREISMDLDEFDTQYPNSIAEARKSPEWPEWEKAISTELEMLHEKNTWELSDIPAERTAIGNRWVFTKKFDEHGNLSRFKARLVAQGFSQIPGQDYSDTFSPVMWLNSFRILCAIAAMTDLEIAQMDIKGAYLNGKLNEEIYMRQPDGFNDGTGRVCCHDRFPRI